MERIKRARLSAGLSQNDLAVQVGTTNMSISRLERGVHSDMRASLLLAIADATGTSLDWIATGRGGWAVSLDVYLTETRPVEVFERNITHNLARMADAAGLYIPLGGPNCCRPRRRPNLSARSSLGFAVLKGDKWRFKRIRTGEWVGSYDGLVRFAESYLAACREYPDAQIRVSR